MDAARFSSTSDLLQTFNNVVCQITGGHGFISLFCGKLSPQYKLVGAILPSGLLSQSKTTLIR